MLTAFLSRADVSRHLQALHLLRELREAFTAHPVAALTETLRFDTTAIGNPAQIRHATFPGVPAWSVTSRVRSPKGSRSLLQLHDAETGAALAVMDAMHLSTLRASMVSALAADVLARPDAKHVAVLGSGAAASSALKALRLVRSVEQVWTYEPEPAFNFERARILATTMSMAIHAADSVAEAVAGADIVLLTGEVTLGDVKLRPGVHVNVLSADTFNSPPLLPTELAASRAFIDGPESALSWGVSMTSLGSVVAGHAPGRKDADDFTLFASTSPAHLDLLAAWHVYEGARHDEALTRIDLEA
ncbi:MAG: hypothetical protein ACO1OB_20590 [Archangium sp.]